MDFSTVEVPCDFEGVSLEEVDDGIRFRKARPGDHLCSPFQCPNCHSQNIRGRNIGTGIEEEAFKCLVIRATLDAFWSRAPGTVKGHVTEVRFMRKYGKALRFDPFPPLGPFPLGQHLGMLQAIMVIMRSTGKGRKGPLVQYGMARQARATSTILWESSPMSGGDLTFTTASAKGRYVATLCPSEGRWFQSFNNGIGARMGDTVKQDRAYTIEVVHRLLEMFEEEWNETLLDIPLISIQGVMFLLVTCLGGMRGFEAVWTDLGALRYDVSYCERLDDESAIAWPIVGRFKGEMGKVSTYFIPIAGTTRSGIQMFTWTQRFIACLEKRGITRGWAFQNDNGKRAVAADFRDVIFDKLKHIQDTTDLIDGQCNIWDDFGIQRSGRRFFTSECINQKVSQSDIEFQCHWVADRAAGRRTVQRGMLQNYAEVRNMKTTLVCPSQAL